MSTHNIQFHDKIRKKIPKYLFSWAIGRIFVGTEKRDRIIDGKRAIRVRAIEVILYLVCLALDFRFSLNLIRCMKDIPVGSDILYWLSEVCFRGINTLSGENSFLLEWAPFRRGLLYRKTKKEKEATKAVPLCKMTIISLLSPLKLSF